MEELQRLVALRQQFSDLYPRFSTDPSLEAELRELVREIEGLQKKIDVESGFAAAQMKVHDLYVKVPSNREELVMIDGNLAADLMHNVGDIMEVAQPYMSGSVTVNLVGMIPSSTVLVYDFVEKGTSLAETRYTPETTRQKLKTVFSSSAKFMETGFTAEKLQEFREETGLTNEQAYDLTRALLRITPLERQDIGKIELAVTDHGVETKLTASNETALELTKAKKNIYQIVKPEEETTIAGVLGIMEEWEDNHKISIVDELGKKHTINYLPTEENISTIKNKIGLQVRVRRVRDSDDRRRWTLVEWLN